MPEIIYALCAATSVGCAGLLLRAYFRTRSRMLLWSGLCFAGLAANNIFVIVDEIIILQSDFSTARLGPAVIGMALLLYGLIWEGE